MPQPLLFPLNRVSNNDIAALQSALRVAKLLQPAFMQQRSRAFQGLLAPTLPANRPWNAVGLPSLIDVPTLIPSVVHELKPYPPTYFKITGTTKDSSGVALGNCTVHLFDSVTDVLIERKSSDTNGYFEFWEAGQPPHAYYVVAYKPGSPDVAGTTVNTLSGA